MAKTKKAPSSERLQLTVEPRTVFGKKLRSLRKKGVIPANIYGTSMKSVAVSIPLKEFVHAYRTAQETGIIYLRGLKEELPVLISHVQLHPVNDTVVHVDLRNVDLKKKIETEVPIVLVGLSEAVAQKGGVLLHLTKTIKIEALPQDIPHEISIDISAIKDIGQEIKVSDLPISSTYVVKDEATLVLASVVAHKEESVTPETTAAAAPEVLTAAKVEEGEAAPASGEPEKKADAPPAKAEEKK